jgi:hypothetical protein
MAKIRNKRDALPAVQRLIDFANSDTPDFEMPVGLAVLELMERLKTDESFSNFRHITRDLQPNPKQRKHLVEALAGAVRKIEDPEVHDALVFVEYVRLRNARAFLEWMVKLPPTPGTRLPEPPVAVECRTDEGCQLRFRLRYPELEGVEVGRIKKCPRPCGRFFWAARKDQHGCKACGARVRQQRWRENYPEKYKAQRYKRAQEQERMRSQRLKSGTK